MVQSSSVLRDAAMKCKSCGADVPPGGVKCEFCGSTVVPPESPSRLAVFEQIKRSAEYERRNSPERLAALPRYPGCAKVFTVVFPLVPIGFGAVGTVAVLFAVAVFGAPAAVLLALCPAFFLVLLGVLIQLQFRKKLRAFEHAPALARAAVITSKRGNGRYFLTAEFEDGSRGEFETLGRDLYDRVAEGDAGVLFTRGPGALDLDRVV